MSIASCNAMSSESEIVSNGEACSLHHNSGRDIGLVCVGASIDSIASQFDEMYDVSDKQYGHSEEAPTFFLILLFRSKMQMPIKSDSASISLNQSYQIAHWPSIGTPVVTLFNVSLCLP